MEITRDQSQPYPLGKPFWMYIVEEREWRKGAIMERIKDLKAMREMIDIELSILEPELSPKPTPKPYTPSTSYPPLFENSIAGFHNPKRHSGMSAESFLELYKARLRKSHKGYHGRILSWLTQNPTEAIIFVRSRFHRTIKQ